MDKTDTFRSLWDRKHMRRREKAVGLVLSFQPFLEEAVMDFPP